MKLRDLDGMFIKRHDEKTGVYRLPVETLAKADGVQFLCPKCFIANKGKVGTHSVICWFVGRVPPPAVPGPGRWNPKGSSLDDLTFVAPGSTSVHLKDSPCGWHGHVTNGEATLK